MRMMRYVMIIRLLLLLLFFHAEELRYWIPQGTKRFVYVLC